MSWATWWWTRAAGTVHAGAGAAWRPWPAATASSRRSASRAVQTTCRTSTARHGSPRRATRSPGAFEEPAPPRLGLSSLVNLVDLELVIVHADPALLDSGAYVPAARRSFEQHSFHAVDEQPELVFEARDDWLGARSAGSMVFRLLPDRLAELGEPWARPSAGGRRTGCGGRRAGADLLEEAEQVGGPGGTGSGVVGQAGGEHPVEDHRRPWMI